MAIRKSQLYSTLWESCNALRGGMDASQYKDYVLIILFVKYLSDKAHQGQTKLRVPENCFFEDFIALKQNEHIGELVNEKLEAIREANPRTLAGLALPNFNDDTKLGSGKTKVETLSKLIGEFQRDALDFSRNRAADDDLLGDAYEYLMKNFAAESGKSKGQFYTPAEVSRVMAKVLHMEDFPYASHTIYDMTCGSGSLLLRALNETPNGKPKLYGQEKDSTTASLAKLNMLLHGVANAEILIGDTLNDPKFKNGFMLRTFDVCVANPPFSQKNWLATEGEEDKYNRWNPSLLAPAKCGDFAFLQHFIASMKADTGRGACILPHGALFRGNAEYNIRRDIIDRHILKGIIGLPPNLFFGTSIPACILILDKKDTHLRPGIFIIDAKEGFTKSGDKNRLREQDIKRITDTWNAQQEIPHFARMVTWDEIEKNDYNLNIPRYIAPRDTEVHHDIDAHLHGGIPQHDVDALSRYWNACPTLRDALFALRPDHRYDLRVKKTDVTQAIHQNDSFLRQQDLFEHSLETWCNEVRPQMLALEAAECHPKQLINEWSERLLQIAKQDESLADPYAVYDYLMNYWADTMQDDCYMINNDGWNLSYSLPGKKKKESYTDLTCDLLPLDVVLRVFFASEVEEITQTESDLADCESEMTSYEEEQAEAFSDLDKVNETQVKRFVKQSASRVSDAEVLAVMKHYLTLCNKKKDINKRLKEQREALTKKVIEKYQFLTDADIRHLVVNEKWLFSIVEVCRDEMRNIAQRLTAEVSDLVTRYEDTLPEINAEVQRYEQEVNNYLQEMGFTL